MDQGDTHNKKKMNVDTDKIHKKLTQNGQKA